MEIKEINLGRLHNEEHYEIMNVMDNKVVVATPAALMIVPQYNIFKARLNREKDALEFISKSTFTVKIALADTKRENTFRGLKYQVLSATYHYEDNKKEAGLNLQVVIDHYGDLLQKGYDEETGSIRNLVEELNNNHDDDLSLLGIQHWVNQLKIDNNAFAALVESRDQESGLKGKSEMLQARLETDQAYKAVVNMVNSMQFGTATPVFEAFITEMNAVIDRYTENIATRKGKNNSDEGNTGEGEVNEGGEGEITPNVVP
jgi:hypothetical protein